MFVALAREIMSALLPEPPSPEESTADRSRQTRKAGEKAAGTKPGRRNKKEPSGLAFWRDGSWSKTPEFLQYLGVHHDNNADAEVAAPQPPEPSIPERRKFLGGYGFVVHFMGHGVHVERDLPWSVLLDANVYVIGTAAGGTGASVFPHAAYLRLIQSALRRTPRWKIHPYVQPSGSSGLLNPELDLGRNLCEALFKADRFGQPDFYINGPRFVFDNDGNGTFPSNVTSQVILEQAADGRAGTIIGEISSAVEPVGQRERIFDFGGVTSHIHGTGDKETKRYDNVVFPSYRSEDKLDYFQALLLDQPKELYAGVLEADLCELIDAYASAADRIRLHYFDIFNTCNTCHFGDLPEHQPTLELCTTAACPPIPDSFVSNPNGDGTFPGKVIGQVILEQAADGPAGTVIEEISSAVDPDGRRERILAIGGLTIYTSVDAGDTKISRDNDAILNGARQHEHLPKSGSRYRNLFSLFSPDKLDFCWALRDQINGGACITGNATVDSGFKREILRLTQFDDFFDFNFNGKDVLKPLKPMLVKPESLCGARVETLSF